MPTKFDFLSPGVQLREVDQSQVPTTPQNPGMLLIGRARKGPAMKPVTVTSLNAFVDIFGNPIDGVRQEDPWRQGNTGAPNYAAYAAQAYLAAGVGPVTYVRLLGKSLDGAVTGDNAPGWYMGSSFGTATLAEVQNGGGPRIPESAAAYGLFVVPSGSVVESTAATLVDILDTVNSRTGTSFKVNVPTAAGGTGADIILSASIVALSGITPAADTIVLHWVDVNDFRDNIVLAIDGTADATKVKYGASAGDTTNGIAGIDAENGTTNPEVTVTATGGMGAAGNCITFTDIGVFDTVAEGDSGASPATLAAGAGAQYTTGSLAAIFYSSGSAFVVSGSVYSGSLAVSGISNQASGSTLIGGNAASYGVKLGLSSSANTIEYFDVTLGTDYTNSSYIRNVLNTDPTTFLNTTNYSSTLTNDSYFLGETFDVAVNRLSGVGTTDTQYFVAGLGDVGTANYDNFRQELTAAKSGWFISQRNPQQKYLFRLIALDDGEEFQNQFYCRIANIKLATTLQPTATFSLQIVKRAGTITQDTVWEEYTNLNLDPNSENYIAKRIGDISTSWNASTDKYDITGLYPNISNYVRVEVATNSGIISSDAPVGFLGPVRPSSVVISGSAAKAKTEGTRWIHGSSSIAAGTGRDRFIGGWPTDDSSCLNEFQCQMEWPTFGMTTANTKLGSQNYPFNEYFGLRHVKTTSLSHDASFQDIARRRSAIDPDMAEGGNWSPATQATSRPGFVFSLEDVVSSSAGATDYYWKSGSYVTATAGTYSIAKLNGLTGTGGLIDGKLIKQFAAPFFGGADGIDVKYADPFNNTLLGVSGDVYEKYTVDQAIEMIRDPEQVKYELVSKPGLVNATLVNKLANVAQERGDALAIVDIKGIYQSPEDNGGTAQTANQTTLLSQLNTNYLIDSSYACTYFPNVRLKDTLNGNNTVLRAPPSVAAIGAIAQSEKASNPWFAPAGFNRGGLSALGGTAGPIVVGTVDHLTKDNRDILYESNVNPIARFPATGDIVIFGQKTLQQTPSALDRINVRRMMIYLKRQIGAIADTILFDQNVNATWLRFKSRADKVLSEVKSELGITEYKLVLDETTTTPDLIDRNIMYAKVFVKPARSIEFIAVDFIITRSGVEF